MSEWKRISTLANVRRGASPRPIGDPSYFGGNVGWVRISDVTKSSRFLRETEQYVSPLGESLSVRVNPGDLVMSICGTLGRPIVIDIPACIHDGFVQFTNLKDVDSVYLFYALQFSESKFNGMGQPGTQTNLNTSLVGRLEIFAPPIETQRRIATILSTLDEVIEATEKLVEKHQQIKAGLMHDLFARGLWTRPELARGDHKGTPTEATAQEGQLRPPPEEAPGLYQDSPLGMIPHGWRVDSIGNKFEIQLGKMLNKLAKSGKYSALYLGNRAVQWDRIDLSSLEEMDFSPSEREKFSLKLGDLLICEGGDVGRTAMWRGEIENCYYQKAIHRLRPKSDEVIPDFMLRFMRYAKDSGHFADFTSQSSIAHLTQEKLASIPMLVPPPDEQHQLVIRFDAIDSQIEQENTHLAKLRQQKQGLMHDLLTGRVPVDRLAEF